MAEIFKRTLYVGWGDLDANAHMRNVAYLDKAVDVRMMFFEAHGFSVREFERLRIGPVILRDEVEYFRELRLLERVDITMQADGGSENGAKFRLLNEFYRENGEIVARLTSTGGWLDLTARRLIVPPSALMAAMNNLARSASYEVLRSSVKGKLD